MAAGTSDPRELAKFNAMAPSWWDPDGDFRPLHDLNPVRLDFIARHLVLGGARVLDVGCGAGILSEGLARAGAQVTGLDLAAEALQLAREHAAENGLEIDYRLEDVADHAASHAGQFHAVTCLEMLEHVPHPEQVVRACAAAVRPGGRVFFSTLNRTFKAFALGVVGAEYVLGLLPRGTHEYGKFIRPSELARAARDAGLIAVEWKGLAYNPFNRSAALSEDLAVNYLVCFRRRD